MRLTGGFLKNQTLKTPAGNRTRPTSEKLRQSVFNISQHHIQEAQFLDLFAGSGAMGIEALSRGAKEATFIENDPKAFKTLRENIVSLELSPLATCLKGDVVTLLKKLHGKTFDIIYVDPPYEKGLAEETVSLIDQLELLHIGGLLFVEEGGRKEIEFPELAHLKVLKMRKVGSTILYQFTTRLSSI